MHVRKKQFRELGRIIYTHAGAHTLTHTHTYTHTHTHTHIHLVSGNDLRDSGGEEVLLNVDVHVLAVAVPARRLPHTHIAYP